MKTVLTIDLILTFVLILIMLKGISMLHELYERMSAMEFNKGKLADQLKVSKRNPYERPYNIEEADHVDDVKRSQSVYNYPSTVKFDEAME